MKKIVLLFLICFTLTDSLAQSPLKVSTFLFTQYTKTLYDPTTGNNPWGIGFGVQAFLKNKTKFTPTVELTGDIYLEDDKVGYIGPNGNELDDVGGMINLFAGASFAPTKDIYFSFLAGPSFINGYTLVGIKPSFGFYFSPSKKWTGKISYINVFNREKTTMGNFGSLSFSIGLKLF